MSDQLCSIYQLNAQQAMAARELGKGAENKVAAAAAGVTERTVYKWKRADKFNRAVKHVTHEAVESFTSALSSDLADARATIIQVMKDESAPHHVRLRAAEMVSDQLRKWLEVTDFAERLEQVEAAVREMVEARDAIL